MSFPPFLCFFSVFFFSFFPFSSPLPSSSPYLSPTILPQNYQKMVKSFKIYSYPPPETLSFDSKVESLFYSSLLHSNFITQNPEEAHLFFIPFAFSSDVSPRSAAYVVGDYRTNFIYWNRTLGADHFFLSCSGVGHGSDRNVVELKKNSVQVSCFPTTPGLFIPHKDVSLPPLVNVHAPAQGLNRKSSSHLGYVRYNWVKDSSLVEQLLADPEILVDSEPSDQLTYEERLAGSKFCLFEYGPEISAIGEAMSFGCVPVVITDRPIQDMPLMDLLTWQRIAVFVGTSGGAKEINANIVNSLRQTCYMRGSVLNDKGIGGDEALGSKCCNNGINTSQNAPEGKELSPGQYIGSRMKNAAVLVGTDEHEENVVVENLLSQQNPTGRDDHMESNHSSGFSNKRGSVTIDEAKKQRKISISRGSLPQWTDEQLDELCSFD